MLTQFLINAAQNIVRNAGDTLFKGFDEDSDRPIHFSHFIPCNQWKVQDNLYIVDESTGDSYFNDSLFTKKFKCLALVVVIPIIHAIGIVLNLANRIAKLVTFSHVWFPIRAADNLLRNRATIFCRDLIVVAFAPIIYLGLEISAIYGLVKPYDGGKLYATLERLNYGKEFIAPCFQPSPKSHLGGGDINKPNSW